MCTYITRYIVFGIVWSLSAWLNETILMRYHDFDDYDDGGALIKSPFKHFKTN